MDLKDMLLKLLTIRALGQRPQGQGDIELPNETGMSDIYSIPNVKTPQMLFNDAPEGSVTTGPKGSFMQGPKYPYPYGEPPYLQQRPVKTPDKTGKK